MFCVQKVRPHATRTLRAAKEDLPLPDPYKDMWKSIKKVIDRLHIVNHKDKKCRRDYNPDKILPKEYNTMASEQLFSWLSRFKKIINSMSQIHHLFFYIEYARDAMPTLHRASVEAYSHYCQA